jgi:hypothetical protein
MAEGPRWRNWWPLLSMTWWLHVELRGNCSWIWANGVGCAFSLRGPIRFVVIAVGYGRMGLDVRSRFVAPFASW